MAMSTPHENPSHGFSMSHTPNISSSSRQEKQVFITDMNLPVASKESMTFHPDYDYDDEFLQNEDQSSDNTPPDKSMGIVGIGKVVESGQEHTGRWTKEEHEAFLSALRQYGKEWKKVAAKVKTRTVVQTRTHAQKYFQKLQKGSSDSDFADIDVGSILESKKGTPGSSKKKPPKLHSHNFTTPERQTSAATHAAAKLMTQMSQVKSNPIPTPSSNDFSLKSSPPDQFYIHPPQSNINKLPMSSTEAKIQCQDINKLVRPPMKIIPPDPDSIMKKGLFPEPSPAACGKRKVMELAAAEMLAGVAAGFGVGGIGGGGGDDGSYNNGDRTQTHNKSENGIINNYSSHANTTLSHTSVAYDEGATPTINNINKSTGFGNLQIMKPEVFGNLASKRNLGQASPSTPWDGQLAALVSEVNYKKKENQNYEGDDECVDKDAEIGSSILLHPLSTCNDLNRSGLHNAVCDGNYEEVNRYIEAARLFGGNDHVSRTVSVVDNMGFSPLHSAVSLTKDEKALNMSICITHLLLSVGANVNHIDSVGNTALHWAVREGNNEVAQMLILKSCPLDVQNNIGETALHWAMRAGRKGKDSVGILLQNGARSALYNKAFKRAIDVAAEGFTYVDLQLSTSSQYFSSATVKDNLNSLSKTTVKSGKSIKSETEIKEICETRSNFFNLCSQGRTLVLHHPECLQHVPKAESDWENPSRIDAILNAINLNHGNSSSIRENGIQISSDFERASLELLSRVHSAEYLKFVNDLSKELERRRSAKFIEENHGNDAPSVVPFTPMVQRTMRKETNVKKGSHSDTSFSAGSLRAARRAAGAVQHAVDCVLVGRNRNAFCVVRPPGHHAGINGLLAGGESCGFCIFNNVAAGAMHALSDENHRPRCERCAIVDIDAHHGNGTEEIVRKCHDPGRLFFFSVHLYDNDKRKGNGYKFYPGTGDEDDVAHNIINVPIAPLWRDKDAASVSGSSSSITEKSHNTRNRSKQKFPIDAGDDDSSTSAQETKSEHRSKSPIPTSSKSTVGPYPLSTGREAYRRGIKQRLLPALRAFNPDLILISMGLDASKGDVGNARHYANGKEAEGINLEPEDYFWTTRKIMEVADICCQGRVISVLEGGYGKTPVLNVGESASSDTTLDKTSFSECALKHLQALIDPYNSEQK